MGGEPKTTGGLILGWASNLNHQPSLIHPARIREPRLRARHGRRIRHAQAPQFVERLEQLVDPGPPWAARAWPLRRLKALR
jgi:hypothetical protein